jgi:hypothetical protein
MPDDPIRRQGAPSREDVTVCTVLLRFSPGARWPLLVAAVRDEFVGRPWDPPAAHWAGSASVGGRDRVAGGTWLAVAPAGPGSPGPALAALLNGAPLPPPAAGTRPSRGALPLAALAGVPLPERSQLVGYDRFHLLLASSAEAAVASWDGVALTHSKLGAGDHILVNDGVDQVGDPLVPHFAPLLAGAATPDPRPGLPPAQAWGDWIGLLAGDGLAPDDPRALIVRRDYAGRAYGSTSASLVALRRHQVRYDFTGAPGPAATWREITPTQVE